jgi:hypothetical protein
MTQQAPAKPIGMAVATPLSSLAVADRQGGVFDASHDVPGVG